LNSSYQAKEDEMDRACGMHGGKNNAYRILAGTSEWKRPLGRLIHRLEYNIKMDLRETRWGVMD
jgi:hypothetical protein